MIFRKKVFGRNNKKVVFLMTGWKAKIWKYYFVIHLLVRYDFCCIVYEYDKDILSPNTKKTISELNTTVDDVLKTIKSFKKQSYQEFNIFGTSLGATLSLMIANKSKDIKKIILNLSGASFAGTIWSWDKINKRFKEKIISQGISLNELEEKWREISPENNLDNLKGKKLLVYLAKNDEIIPYFQGVDLIKKIKERKIKYDLVINNFGGHLLNGFINLFKYKRYIEFLISKE